MRPLIPYVVFELFWRLSVSVPVAGMLAGSSASLNVTANESPLLIVPFLFVVTRLAADVVGAAVS